MIANTLNLMSLYSIHVLNIYTLDQYAQLLDIDNSFNEFWWDTLYMLMLGKIKYIFLFCIILILIHMFGEFVEQIVSARKRGWFHLECHFQGFWCYSKYSASVSTKKYLILVSVNPSN